DEGANGDDIKSAVVDVLEKFSLNIRKLNLKVGSMTRELQEISPKDRPVYDDKHDKVIRDIDIDISLERPTRNENHDYPDQQVEIAIGNVRYIIYIYIYVY